MSLYCKIKKTFPDFVLDVEFEAYNQIVAVMGASGCGKSMTLRCIAGIETPDEGIIILNGKTLFDSSSRINLSPQQRKTGLLFQDYALFPNMTVMQNVRTGLKDKNSQKLEELLQQYFLADVAGHYPHQLSGGQKQRCALARMMATNPDIIMLDEPFSAMDQYLRWQLEQELTQELQNYQKTVLFVSHNSSEVYRMAESVMIMDKGKNQPIRSKKDIFFSPLTRQEALLIGCRNIYPAIISENTVILKEPAIAFPKPPTCPDRLAYIGIPDKSIQTVKAKESSQFTLSMEKFSSIQERYATTYTIWLKDSSQPLYWTSEDEILTTSQTLYLNRDALYYLV